MDCVRSVQGRTPRGRGVVATRSRLFQINRLGCTALWNLTSAEPGAGLSVFEGSMPASWAFLFWFLDALVEDFILPGARHERLRPPDLTSLVSANGK